MVEQLDMGLFVLGWSGVVLIDMGVLLCRDRMHSDIVKSYLQGIYLNDGIMSMMM